MKTYSDSYNLEYFETLKTFASKYCFDASYEGYGEITLHYEHNGNPAAIGFAGSYGKNQKFLGFFVSYEGE